MCGFSYPDQLERWSMFEAVFEGSADRNPFVDFALEGSFSGPNETVKVSGFYDGGGVYRVRFMPSFTGFYTFRVQGTFSERTFEGGFEVLSATGNNHGPVRVANTFHFAYEDGTPYYPMGTTCYAWTHQPLQLQRKTLETLAEGCFNKIRFCVFPKHYDYNLKDPITFPYEGTPVDASGLTAENFMAYAGAPEGNDWDFSRFNPEHFRHVERQIAALLELGIEADLIIMHPYDRWGFSQMTAEQDDLYWNYVIARFAAYRNVWWSLANEYDLLRAKTLADWERYAEILCRRDPYGHLRSIHNCIHFYDHSRPWITHCSIQRLDLHKTAEFTAEWRERYRKPVVIDEIAYEGNINHCWGNISAQELVRRFWEAAVRGGYAGHGETYTHPEDVLWWSHGGELHGESPDRIRFLHTILRQTPGIGLVLRTPPDFAGKSAFTWDDVVAVPADAVHAGSYFLLYFGLFRPSFRIYHIDDVNGYEVDVIDTWNMTVTRAGVFRGVFRVELPGREYMAVRIKKI